MTLSGQRLVSSVRSKEEHTRREWTGRPLTVNPRRKGYKHRAIIAVVAGHGMTEHGESVSNLPAFAASMDPHLWVTTDPASLLTVMVDAFNHLDPFNYQILESRSDDSDAISITATRLTRFGFNARRARAVGMRNQAMHIVWNPVDMTRNPADVIDGDSHKDLMRFAVDVRDWCKRENIPLPTTLAGIASSLLRDKRFYPEPRGRVPQFTNERVRRFLPGVYSELRGRPVTTYREAVALDQRRAYHRAAATIPLPDPTTLYARGYFNEPETPRLWAERGGELYARTMRQAGVVAVRAGSRLTHKNETRPPAINYLGTRVIYLWTNEVELCERHGLDVHGITAAWTSTLPDSGMPRYGPWAEGQIDGADGYRRRWLKPTLHAVYGLLAARPRELRIGHRIGRGTLTDYILGAGHPFPVHETVIGSHAPATTNVAMLGVLQAEIRARSMKLANALMAEGVNVLHVHADGLHVEGPVPLMEHRTWTIEPRTNLRYLDRVSWLADEGNCLPGRDQQQRVEVMQHHGRVLSA